MALSQFYCRKPVWMLLRKLAPVFAFSLPVLTCAFASGLSPRTLYKPRDIENARANIEQHGWARRILESWKNSTDFSISQDRDYFEKLVPGASLGNHRFQACPACVISGGSWEGTLDRWNGIWSPAAPCQIACAECGTIYPSEDYPETLTLDAPRMGQSFTFYQTPAEQALGDGATPEERSMHALVRAGMRRDIPVATSFTGLINFRRAHWAWGQALALARVYALTGDVRYAERSAWILDRFARVFPNYLYHSAYGAIADWPQDEVASEMGSRGLNEPRYEGRFPPDAILHPYNRTKRSNEEGEYSSMGGGGFWSSGRLQPHGRTDGGPLRDMIIAYDLTREARYPGGELVYDQDMQRRIVEELLLAGARNVEQWDTRSNKGVAVYSVSAAVGLLLGQPERMRRALWGFDLMLEEAYHFDGFYSQSPGYADHNFNNLGGLYDLIYGYSDPPGYLPEEGNRIENLNPFAEGRFRLILKAMTRMLAPGNRLPVIGNTPADKVVNTRYLDIMAARMGEPYLSFLEASVGKPLSEWGTGYSLWYRKPNAEAEGAPELPFRTEWFPGWHVGVMRGNRAGENDTALYFIGNESNWTLPWTTHRHRDILSVNYYAFGRELIFDHGYQSTDRARHRPGDWSDRWRPHTLTHTHNLVVVDEEVQRRQSRGWQATGMGSNLELFGAAPGVEMIQASGFNVYSQCDEYRRTCAQIQLPDGHNYVVDFFRVRGGRIHQYTMQCNGSMVGFSPSDPPLKPASISDVWSIWLENALQIKPEAPYTFTWNHKDVCLDLMFLNPPEEIHRFIVADSPGERSPREKPGMRPPVQKVIAEAKAAGDEDALATRYAVIIAPYISESSPILSAVLLESEKDSGSMAVEVSVEGRTDYIISARDQKKRSYGPVSAAGRFAFLSVDADGNVVSAYLLAGTMLEYDGIVQLELPEPSTTLKVKSVRGRTFSLGATLNSEIMESARYLLADGPRPYRANLPRPRTGFEIESAGGDSITVRDYPVPQTGNITILHAAWF